jgi:hypothetical protein
MSIGRDGTLEAVDGRLGGAFAYDEVVIFTPDGLESELDLGMGHGSPHGPLSSPSCC